MQCLKAHSQSRHDGSAVVGPCGIDKIHRDAGSRVDNQAGFAGVQAHRSTGIGHTVGSQRLGGFVIQVDREGCAGCEHLYAGIERCPVATDTGEHLFGLFQLVGGHAVTMCRELPSLEGGPFYRCVPYVQC